MAAVITDKLKTQILLDLQKDFNDSDNYYFAGIGKSEDWNDSDIAIDPRNSIRDERNSRQGLQSIKNITDLSFVIPRYNWISGAVYSAYDDNYVGYPTNAFYVMNDNQQVYMCLQQGKTNANPPQTIASTVQPTGNTTGTPFRTADGYMWKFMYTIGALKGSKFISSAYIPVNRVQDSAGATLGPGELAVDSDSPAEDVEQQAIQNNAVAGQILGYVVTNTGSGYTSVPTVTIKGNGSDAKGVATVAGGAIVNIRVKDSSDGTIAFGSGYDYASVEIAGGGGDSATARAVIAPKLGLGYDARKDFKSSALMFNTKPSGAENDDFLIGQDFRQVMLFKNMRYDSDNSLFTRETGLGLTKLDITSVADGPFTNDKVIQGSTSGAKAFIDNVDSNGDLLIHQSEYTGFRSFQSSETISIVEGGGSTTATISSIVNSEVNRLSGDLLYIDNRAAVTRETNQTEDLKIVIQL